MNILACCNVSKSSSPCGPTQLTAHTSSLFQNESHSFALTDGDPLDPCSAAAGKVAVLPYAAQPGVNVLAMARYYHVVAILASVCAASMCACETRMIDEKRADQVPARLRPWPCELSLQILCTPKSQDRQIDAFQVSAYEHAEYSKSSKHLNYSYVS